MKHIKLFEQFENEEDWWDKESPFDEEPTIEVGDVVVCINNKYCEDELDLGSNYIVEQISFSRSRETRFFCVKKEEKIYTESNPLEEDYYNSDRFKKIR